LKIHSEKNSKKSLSAAFYVFPEFLPKNTVDDGLSNIISYDSKDLIVSKNFIYLDKLY